MGDFLTSSYLWLKAFHIISVICWMAGLLYLPRLFVYHAQNQDDATISTLLKTMEYKLYKYIMSPAMMATWVFGILIIFAYPSVFDQKWIHVKLVLVLLMTIFHVKLGRWLKSFAADANSQTHKYFRAMNEVPTLLMIIIVILAIVKPF